MPYVILSCPSRPLIGGGGSVATLSRACYKLVRQSRLAGSLLLFGLVFSLVRT